MDYQWLDTWDDAHIAQLVDLYQEEWWTKGRTLEQTTMLLQHSDLCFGLCETDTKQLVGFVRVLTDYVFKAVIFDVMVAKAHQGKGLGHKLMEVVCTHPALAKVAHIELYCLADLVPFYERFRFTEDLEGLRLMRVR